MGKRPWVPQVECVGPTGTPFKKHHWILYEVFTTSWKLCGGV